MHGWMEESRPSHYNIHHVYAIEKYEKNTIPEEEKVPPIREKKKKGDKVVLPTKCRMLIIDRYSKMNVEVDP